MAVPPYMDHHVHRAITSGLRVRGVDVLTAEEDGARRLADPVLLDRATILGRVLVTQDQDLLIEAQRRQIEGIPFSGVIYGHQRKVSVSDCIRDLEIIGLAGDSTDVYAKVTYLPL